MDGAKQDVTAAAMNGKHNFVFAKPKPYLLQLVYFKTPPRKLDGDFFIMLYIKS